MPHDIGIIFRTRTHIFTSGHTCTLTPHNTGVILVCNILCAVAPGPPGLPQSAVVPMLQWAMPVEDEDMALWLVVRVRLSLFLFLSPLLASCHRDPVQANY